MVSDTNIEIGDVIKIHNWFGVVLETHFDDKGALSLIRVQTARNIFRGHGPEYLDVRMLPEAIQPATLVELQQEIETHQRLLDGALARMIRSAEKTDALPIAAD